MKELSLYIFVRILGIVKWRCGCGVCEEMLAYNISDHVCAVSKYTYPLMVRIILYSFHVDKCNIEIMQCLCGLIMYSVDGEAFLFLFAVFLGGS